MNCSEAEELLGAYALDALPGDEAAAMRAHLATCEEHAQKARELASVVVRLPAMADSVQPPQELRYRVMGAIARDAEVATAGAAPRPIASAPSAEREERRSRWRIADWRGWGAVAAVLAIAVAGLLAWNIMLRSDSESGADALANGATGVSTLVSAQDPSQAVGAVVYFGDEDMATVMFDTGQPLDAGHAYQVWRIGGGQPESIGVTAAGPSGPVSIAVPFDSDAGGTIAVTIEPAGGSPQPTTDPILHT